MDTKDIRCFLRCYEERSMNRAARQLFITPQGLSRIIRHLEEEFRTELFIRTQKGIFPTPAGEIFYQHCSDLLYKMEEIEHLMHRCHEKEVKTNVGFASGVLQALPFYQIEQYRKKHPEFQISWEESTNEDIKNKVKSGEIDLGFVIGHISDDRICEEELFTTRIQAIIYEGHPYYNRTSLSIADLQDEALITLNNNYQSYSNLLHQCRTLGFAPNIIVRTIDSDLIYRLCAEKMGLGIDVNFHHSRNRYPTLHSVEIGDSIPWSIYMVYQKKGTLPASMEHLIRFARRTGINK